MSDTVLTLIAAGAARGITSADIQWALKYDDSADVMKALKGLGLSLSDIGVYFNLSRQRVGQVVGGSERARPVDRTTRTIEEIQQEVWTEACDDLSWWTGRGLMDKSRIVERLVEAGFSWPISRQLCQAVAISKTEVILFCKFGISSDRQSKVDWFNSKIEKMKKFEILALLNKGQALQIPVTTFNRHWRELWLQADRQKKLQV